MILDIGFGLHIQAASLTSSVENAAHTHRHMLVDGDREELFNEMMQEREDIAAKRSSCLNVMAALRDALAILETIPQTLASRINSPARWLAHQLPAPAATVVHA